MKPISYRAVGQFRKRRKLKSGLAPTGVFRQIWYLHNSFQPSIYAAPRQKTNPQPSSAGVPPASATEDAGALLLLHLPSQHGSGCLGQSVFHALAATLIGNNRRT